MFNDGNHDNHITRCFVCLVMTLCEGGDLVDGLQLLKKAGIPYFGRTILYTTTKRGVVYRGFCLNSGAVSASTIASRRWWCIEYLFPSLGSASERSKSKGN